MKKVSKKSENIKKNCGSSDESNESSWILAVTTRMAITTRFSCSHFSQLRWFRRPAGHRFDRWDGGRIKWHASRLRGRGRISTRALAVHMVPLLAQVTASTAVSCIARRRYQVWMWCGTGSAEGSRPRPPKLPPQIMAPCEIVRHLEDVLLEAPRRQLRGRLVSARALETWKGYQNSLASRGRNRSLAIARHQWWFTLVLTRFRRKCADPTARHWMGTYEVIPPAADRCGCPFSCSRYPPMDGSDFKTIDFRAILTSL